MRGGKSRHSTSSDLEKPQHWAIVEVIFGPDLG